MGKKTPLPIRIEGDVAYVPLTKGYEAVIDAADVPLVSGRNWYAHAVAGLTTYACTNAKPRGTIRMHRLILGLPQSGDPVDHADRNGLNNRRSNLREATKAENAYNSAPHVDNACGVKGVIYLERTRRWRARIMAAGKVKHLGYFPTKEAAGEAYAKAAAELHGEFARLR